MESGNRLSKFQLKIPRESDLELAEMTNRLETLISLKNDMINENRKQIEEVLDKIIRDKWNGKSKCKK